LEQSVAVGSGESTAKRLLSSVCALGVCGVFFAVQQLRALPWNGLFDRTGPTLVALGAIALITVPMPWLGSARRHQLALAGSILFGAMTVGWLLVVALAFACLTVRISRSNWKTWQKLTLLLGVWVAVAIGKWGAAATQVNLPFLAWSLYWAFLPAAIACLVVERARGQLDGVARSEEWLYLLALPRFFLPFIQPIGAGSFVRSRGQTHTAQMALSALGLAVWGGACLLAIKHTHYSVKSPSETLQLMAHGPRILRNAVRIYAINAAQIFCAVSLFRLLGHDLGSGFRYPLLATSFNDLYRRWNYYYFEFVTSIFYLPLVGWLRRRVPLSVAYVLAGYPSMLFGVWALDNVGMQLALGWNASSFLREASDLQELGTYLGVWSFILIPALVLSRARKLRRYWWWQAGAHLLTLGVCAGLLAFFFSYGLTIY
jgi:hypothetical protein